MASFDDTSPTDNKSALTFEDDDATSNRYRNPEVYARYVFNSRGQKPHETVDEYFEVLQMLSKTCNFGDMLDGLVRDRILVGIRDERTRDRLLREAVLTLTNCVEICRVTEAENREGATLVKVCDQSHDSTHASPGVADCEVPPVHFEKSFEKSTPVAASATSLDRSAPPKKRTSRLRNGEPAKQTASKRKRPASLRESSRRKTRSLQPDVPLKDDGGPLGDPSSNVEPPEMLVPPPSMGNSDEETEVEAEEERKTDRRPTRKRRAVTRQKRVESGSVDCQECGKVFPNRTKLSRHKDSFHRHREKVKCDICGKMVTKYYLPLHKNIHTMDRPFPCGECGKLCPTKNHLEYHKNATGHMREGVVKVKQNTNCFCEICGKKFSNKTNLRKHVEVHTGEKKCECPICGKELIHTDYLQRHMVTHSEERPYQCDLCGKKFKKKLILREHQSRHSMDKSSACEYCGKVFAIKGDLLKHVQLHTGQKKFACQFCPKRFNVGTQLRYHTMSVHTKHKPYVCEKCGKGFIKLCLLKVHSSTHNTTREFGCKQCERTFKTSRSLKEHERIHSGERLFVCHLCGKEFYRSGHLKQHLKTHQKQGAAVGVKTPILAPVSASQQAGAWLPLQPPPEEILAKKFLAPLNAPALPHPLPHWFPPGDGQGVTE